MRKPGAKRKSSQAGFHHKHSLGQNFITDDALFERLVDAAGVGEGDAVLEIGAGAGGLTRALAARCRQVVAVEIDEALRPILALVLEKHDNARVVFGDVMRLNLPEATRELGAFHVVANLPYYLTTPVLEMLLGGKLPLLSVNVMLQAEAASRVLARPGTGAYGMLAVQAQYRTAPAVALRVPAACFTPPPKVDSVFLTMPFLKEPAVRVRDEALFFRVARAAFAMRRKTMANNLAAAFHMEKGAAQRLLVSLGLSETVRGEALSLEEMARISDSLDIFFAKPKNFE